MAAYAKLEFRGSVSTSSRGPVWTDCGRDHDEPAPALRLFCFPYAGAGAFVFRSWQNEIARGIQICGIQLPGRGARFNEPRYTRLRPLVQALAEDLWPQFQGPFALLGHSLGALIAFELARELRKRGREPAHLMVFGLRAPQIPIQGPRLHSLPESQFIEAVTALNGMPEQLTSEPEFLKVMLPTLQSDFEIYETYEYVAEPPLTCRLSAYAGRHDLRAPAQDLIFWQPHSSGKLSCRIFPGDHFFVDTARRAVLSAVSVELVGTLIGGLK